MQLLPIVISRSLCKTFLLRGTMCMVICQHVPASYLLSAVKQCTVKLLYTLHHVCLNKLSEKSLEPKGLIFSERFLEERQPKLMPGKITTSLFILHSS